MAKVIKSIKKFSTRKLTYNQGNDSPRKYPTLEDDGIVDDNPKEEIDGRISKSKPHLKRSSAVIIIKKKDENCKDESKVKGKADGKETKKKLKKKGKEKDREKEDVKPTQKKTRKRIVQKTDDPTEEGQVVDRENDDTSGSGPLAQDEIWEEYSVKDNNVVDEDVDDFVGSYDFKTFRESDEHPTTDFSCLSPEDIIAAQKKQIQQVADLLVISASNASNLLRHYHWKTEVLLTRYFDDPKTVIKEAGLVANTTDGNAEAKLTSSGECLVCCEIVDPTQSCALTCEHRFCHDCWGSYLTMKITEGEVIRINCPALNCDHSVPDEVVKKLVPKETYEKFLRFVTRSFVEDNAHVTWCPAPRCGNAITTDMISGQTVQCSCGFKFCFSCHHEAHGPASCEQVKLWIKKCQDDSETGNWLGSNTKDCPRCMVSVEKNGGCNHMTCRQCGYEWCWLCGRIWKGHSDYYSCSKYEKDQKKKEKKEKNGKKSKKQSRLAQLEKEREDKRKALERYLLYYTKYLEFDSNHKNAGEIREKAKAKMALLQSEQSTLAEVKFIETSTEVLIECQNILKYSCVYNYYLDDNSAEKHIFQFLQDELAKTAASLAEILDAPGILRRRTEAVDLTKLAQTKKDNLLKCYSE